MAHQDSHPTHSGSGNFFSGLFFGTMAGVAGYFLFGTEEGKKARQKLQEEWEKAKGHLIEEGVLEPVHAEKTFPHMVQHTIQRIIEPSRRRPVSKKGETKMSPKKDNKRFKGV